MRYLLSKLYNRVKAAIRLETPYPVAYNVNAVDEATWHRRALLIYVIKPFVHGGDAPEVLGHQNARQCKQITAILGDLGYVVDVVDVQASKFKPSKHYDLVISNTVRDRSFKGEARRVYLASTLNHSTHNRNLRRRHERLSERRGCQVQVRRQYSEVMPYVTNSDAIIGFGNEFTVGTWKEVFAGRIYPFNNYGFRETQFPLDSKDFSTARQNFLFFASGSQVQKGLDLLLEIFPKHPHLHLHVCSRFEHEGDFCACYHQELYETPNVHPIGWVQVNSPGYYDLVKTCGYVITPTCSEGQPGSVVQCMYAGLIPLVTMEAGIDTGDFGTTFADDSLEEVERVIVELSQMPEGWHREQSIKTRDIATKEYSEDAFVARWRDILTELVGGPRRDREPGSRRFRSGATGLRE